MLLLINKRNILNRLFTVALIKQQSNINNNYHNFKFTVYLADIVVQIIILQCS